VTAAGVLTFVPGGTDRDQRFRNDVAEIEGRLRFILTGKQLNPVFGGEPLHPGDRAITSPSLARLHLHHVVDGGACLLVLLLVGPVDPALVAAAVRYVDARVSPPLPLLLLAAAELGFAPHGPALAAAGELRAIGRDCEVHVAAIREDDPRFDDFYRRVDRTFEDAAAVRRDVRFRDDLRRHHHLSVCPRGGAPPSWRLPVLQALAAHGITASVADQDEVRANVRAILGSAGRLLDPRLVEARDRAGGLRPGDLVDHATALAVRDLAAERHASTVALGDRLPGGASPHAVAAILRSLRGPSGPAIPVCTATGEDDAGAISQYLLQRASVDAAPGRFFDPQHVRPAHASATFAIRGLAGDHAILAVPPGGAGSELVAALGREPATAARLSFGAESALAAVLETRHPAEARGDELLLPLPTTGQAVLHDWPGDRLALIPGRHEERLRALLAEARIAVTSPERPLARRTPASHLPRS
jgi:hypothetical protein